MGRQLVPHHLPPLVPAPPSPHSFRPMPLLLPSISKPCHFCSPPAVSGPPALPYPHSHSDILYSSNRPSPTLPAAYPCSVLASSVLTPTGGVEHGYSPTPFQWWQVADGGPRLQVGGKRHRVQRWQGWWVGAEHS